MQVNGLRKIFSCIAGDRVFPAQSTVIFFTKTTMSVDDMVKEIPAFAGMTVRSNSLIMSASS